MTAGLNTSTLGRWIRAYRRWDAWPSSLRTSQVRRNIEVLMHNNSRGTTHALLLTRYYSRYPSGELRLKKHERDLLKERLEQTSHFKDIEELRKTKEDLVAQQEIVDTFRWVSFFASYLHAYLCSLEIWKFVKGILLNK